ncbi:MAG: AAA family ATPase [Bacteroidales bacterium]|nr:AAA family ATPase [Bacteroidales bacterium]
MLKTHLSNKITEALDHPPTMSQKELIGKLSSFIINSEKEEIFLIKGYAGTGKTSTISALVKVFDKTGQKSVLLAPTGRAAKVLASYSGKNANTIHKKIYRQRSSKDGMGVFTLDKNLHTNTLFIVDEASMIANTSRENTIFGSGRLLDDLIQYIYNGKGCRMVLIGDTAQLPPVGIPLSPALEIPNLELYGKALTEVFLSDIVRQSAESGILSNATRLRELVSNNIDQVPQFALYDFSDIVDIKGDDLLEKISDSYSKHGIENTIVICRSNKTANKYNKGIRNRILFREEELTPGDLLMVVKNNYFWASENPDLDFIANGDIIEVKKIRRIEEMYGYRFADVVVKLLDYDLELELKIMLNVLDMESASLTMEDNKNMFYKVHEDYTQIKPKKKQFELVKNNPHFNALQVKFAYAITCHKAQGGQWACAFIDQGYITKERINIEYLRWLYTALTRATEMVYLVNFPEMMFQ